MNAPPNSPLHAPGIPPAEAPGQGVPAGRTRPGPTPFPPVMTPSHTSRGPVPFNPDPRTQRMRGNGRWDLNRRNPRATGENREHTNGNDDRGPMLSGPMSVYPRSEHQTVEGAPIDRASLEAYWHEMNPQILASSSLPSQGFDARRPQSIVDRSSTSTVWCFYSEPSHRRWANYIASDGSGEMLSVWPSEELVPTPSRQSLSFVSECPPSQTAFSSAPR